MSNTSENELELEISQTVYNTKETRAHTHRELIETGASRVTKGQEALWPPVRKARRRHKRQHLHRCRGKCQRRRRRHFTRKQTGRVFRANMINQSITILKEPHTSTREAIFQHHHMGSRPCVAKRRRLGGAKSGLTPRRGCAKKKRME